MQTIIKLENLSYSYHTGHQILNDISTEMSSEEVFVLLGHNGAGKTTLIRLLLDFVRGFSGKIELFGQSPENETSRTRIGFMSEQPVIYQYENASSYLNYFADLSGVVEKDRVIKELLELTGLNQHGKKNLDQYSKGMLQRLNLARALLNDPDLLIMDEPIIGLDPLGQDLIEKVVKDRRARSRAVFINTHSISFAAKVADRVGFLMGGKLKKVFKREEFASGAEVLERAFLAYASDLSLEDKAQ